MREEELDAEKRSIEILNDLKSKKKHKYRDLDEAEDRSMVLDDTEKELVNAVNKVENDLMEIEMLL